MRNLDEAERAFRAALEVDPLYEFAYSGMGQVYMLRGLADKALSVFKRAVELGMNDSATHYNLALIYTHKKEWGKAAMEYRRVVEEDPGDCDALYGEAFALDSGGS